MSATLRPDFPPGSPDDNPLLEAVIASLVELSPRAQRAMLRFLSTWAGAEAEQRAMLLKLLLPDLSDGVVAQVAGVDRSTLFRRPRYRRLKAILAAPPSLPRGAVDGDGGLAEAWLEDAG